MKIRYPYLRIAITICLLWYLFQKANITTMAWHLHSLSWHNLLIAVLIASFAQTIRLYKWILIARSASNKPSLQLVKYYFIGMFYSSVTPGKVGDIAKAHMLVTKRVSKSQAYALTMYDRVLDLLALALVSAASIAIARASIEVFPLNLLVFGISVSLILLVALLASPTVTQTWCIPIMSKSRLSKATTVLSLMHQSLRSYKTIPYTVLSLFVWACMGSTISWLSYAFGYNTTILTAVSIATSAAIAGLAPVSLAGFGVREGIISTLLSASGIDTSAAVTISVLYTTITYLLMVIIGGLMHLSPKEQ